MQDISKAYSSRHGQRTEFVGHSFKLNRRLTLLAAGDYAFEEHWVDLRIDYDTAELHFSARGDLEKEVFADEDGYVGTYYCEGTIALNAKEAKMNVYADFDKLFEGARLFSFSGRGDNHVLQAMVDEVFNHIIENVLRPSDSDCAHVQGELKYAGRTTYVAQNYFTIS